MTTVSLFWVRGSLFGVFTLVTVACSQTPGCPLAKALSATNSWQNWGCKGDLLAAVEAMWHAVLKRLHCLCMLMKHEYAVTFGGRILYERSYYSLPLAQP